MSAERAGGGVKTRTILAANPSFAHPIERGFWTLWQGTARRQGWRIVMNAARRIDHKVDAFTLPARLSDVSGFLPDFDVKNASRLPEWMTQGDFDLLADWEHRRWQKRRADPRITVGLSKLAWYVDTLFNVLQPAACATTNKIDHGCSLYRAAALHYGAEPIFVERSPIDSFWVERDGMFSESIAWERYPARDKGKDEFYRAVGARIRERIRKNPEGFRKQQEDAGEAEEFIRRLPRPILFLPMDNSLWTGWAQLSHPQGDVDYPADFRSPSASLAFLAECAAELGGCVLMKRHPADLEEYDPPAHLRPFIHEASGPLETFISHSDAVVTFLTKVAFTSLAFGKPTVTLAHNPAALSGASFHASTRSAAKEAIATAVALRWQPEQDIAVETFLGWLESEFFVTSTPGLAGGQPTISQLMTRVGARMLMNSQPLIALPEASLQPIRQLTVERRIWPRDLRPYEGRVRVFFDVRRLTKAHLYHSGISRFARSLLDQLISMPDLEVIPVLDGPGRNALNFAGRPPIPIEEVARSVGRELNAIYLSPYDPLPPPDFTGAIPRVVVIHDVLHLTRPDLYSSEGKADNIVSVLSSVEPADYAVTVSEYTRSETLPMLRCDPSHVRTIHIASSGCFSRIPAEAATHGLANIEIGSENFIVVFAQADPRKNTLTTFSAINRMLADGRLCGCKIVIVTSAVRNEQVLGELAEIFSDMSNIVPVDSPTDEQLVALLNKARLMVFASLAEGFGLPVLEAMACGCPVVTSSVSSLPEIAGDAVQYVDPSSASQIEDAIQRLLRSEELRSQLVSRGIARAAQFRLQDTAAAIMRFGRDALGAHIETSLSETALVPVGFAELHPEFRTNGAPVVLSGATAMPGRQYWIGRLPVHSLYLIENDAFGVHRARLSVPRVAGGEELHLRLPIRAEEGMHATISCERRDASRSNRARLEVEVDLAQKELRRRSSSWDVRDVRIREERNGWRVVEIVGSVETSGPLTLDIDLTARVGRASGAEYKGERRVCFEFVPPILSQKRTELKATAPQPANVPNMAVSKIPQVVLPKTEPVRAPGQAGRIRDMLSRPRVPQILMQTSLAGVVFLLAAVLLTALPGGGGGGWRIAASLLLVFFASTATLIAASVVTHGLLMSSIAFRARKLMEELDRRLT